MSVREKIDSAIQMVSSNAVRINILHICNPLATPMDQ